MDQTRKILQLSDWSHIRKIRKMALTTEFHCRICRIKLNMAQTRKDLRGRVLRKGESQRRSDERYVYTYTDTIGRRKYVYAQDLVTLREKEAQIMKDQMDGLDIYVAGKATVNFVFDRYMSLKNNLKPTTKSNYLYMYDRFIRDTFGKRNIAEIKYSDVVQFYNHLTKKQELKINTLETIHTLLHPTFQLAVRDDIIRKNPTDGVMAELKKNLGMKTGVRHALTIPQQRAFMEYIATHRIYFHWWPIFTIFFGTGCRIGDDDDKIRLNQRKPSKYKGLRRFGPEKNLQRINKFMKERPIFYKNLIQMKENIRFYLRCFYCITKVMILQFNSENRTELARNG